MIYLDYAAATPVDDDVLAAAQPFFQTKFYNPSARYAPAKGVRQSLESARASVAQVLGCRSEEVFFTAGGTEANNLAIHGLMQQYPEGSCVISAIEHDSVYEPAQQYNCREVSVTEEGIVDIDSLSRLIDDKTVLVSIGYVNSEIGTIQPLRRISQLLADVKADRKKQGNDLPIYLHTDACQAGNYLSLAVHTLGVDLLTLNGGKIYGFKQSGCLFVGRHVRLKPYIGGGGQEWGLRSGTENVPQAVGFATALEKAQNLKESETKRLLVLQKQFMSELTKALPECFINGSKKHRIPNNIHMTIPGQHNEILQLKLEQTGILTATGSACSANKKQVSSRVLLMLGKTDKEAQSSLRFTMGRETTSADVTKTVTALAKFSSDKQ